MRKQGGGCSWVWGGVQWFGGRLSLIDWLITHLRAYLGSPHFPCQTTFLLHPFPTNLHPQEGKDSYRQHTAGPGELGPEHRLSDATPVTFPSHPLILVPSSFGLTHCQQVSKKRHVVIRRLFFSCTCDRSVFPSVTTEIQMGTLHAFGNADYHSGSSVGKGHKLLL